MTSVAFHVPCDEWVTVGVNAEERREIGFGSDEFACRFEVEPAEFGGGIVGIGYEGV